MAAGEGDTAPAADGGGVLGDKRPPPGEDNRPPAKKAARPAGSARADTVYRLLTPSRFAGYVIGKGGATIRQVRQDTGSRLKVAEGLLGSEERVIIVSSKTNDSFEQCAAQSAVRALHQKLIEAEQTAPASADPSDVASPKTQLRLLVPQSQAGCIIGKGGVFIKQAREETGASVRILPPEELPLVALDNDRVLQMNGNLEQLQKALAMIARKLWENPPRDSPGGPPPCVWAALGQSGPAGPQAAELGGGMAPGMGAPPVMGGGGGGPMMPQAPGGGGMLPMQMQPASASASSTKRTITVPNSQVGWIIGAGGSNIAHIREKSGAHIKVPPQTPGQAPNSLRAVDISGTPQQVSIAESMIRASGQARN
mmetsp:Transcript_22580/g.56855  ORF Transcript_22580/g.56855 Transcript_22580/m.56855 type:complete len:368 (+) Transcript_22580:271-1374(+)